MQVKFTQLLAGAALVLATSLSGLALAESDKTNIILNVSDDAGNVLNGPTEDNNYAGGLIGYNWAGQEKKEDTYAKSIV